jgi:hypothetical protein
VITFEGTLGHAAQPLISIVANNLTGGTNSAPTVAHTTVGAAEENDVQTLSISGNPTGGTFTLAFRGKVDEQGRIIRFFEQAFEWEQMTYFFYPYYWGRKETWYDKVLKDNADPAFADFLNAGEARVVTPVRPIFNDDIGYFVTTGQIWSGGDLPHITDTDYLPITEEIKESANAPGDEKPQGDSWEIIVPTQLVKLRTDGKRRSWKRPDPNKWEWVPQTSEWEPPSTNVP